MYTQPRAYDRFMGRWSRKLALEFIRFVNLRPGSRVLDVGCGTGATIEALTTLVPDVKITGIDPSQAFVEHARDTSPNARLEIGSALALPFESQAFDASLSCLVLNFVGEPAKAVREMRRVTKPGGVVASGIWDHQAGMMMLKHFWQVVEEVDPAFTQGEPEALLDLQSLTALWRDAGLVDLQTTALSITTRFTSFEDYWQPFLLGAGPSGAYVQSLSSERRDQIARRLRDRLLADGTDKPFELAARSWAIRGTVPV